MKMGGQKDPRYLMPNDLAAFAKEAGIGLRAVKGQLGELCEKVAAEVAPLAQIYRDIYANPPIVNDIFRVVDQRIHIPTASPLHPHCVPTASPLRPHCVHHCVHHFRSGIPAGDLLLTGAGADRFNYLIRNAMLMFKLVSSDEYAKAAVTIPVGMETPSARPPRQRQIKGPG